MKGLTKIDRNDEKRLTAATEWQFNLTNPQRWVWLADRLQHPRLFLHGRFDESGNSDQIFCHCLSLCILPNALDSLSQHKAWLFFFRTTITFHLNATYPVWMWWDRSDLCTFLLEILEPEQETRVKKMPHCDMRVMAKHMHCQKINKWIIIRGFLTAVSEGEHRQGLENLEKLSS